MYHVCCCVNFGPDALPLLLCCLTLSTLTHLSAGMLYSLLCTAQGAGAAPWQTRSPPSWGPRFVRPSKGNRQGEAWNKKARNQEPYRWQRDAGDDEPGLKANLKKVVEGGDLREPG